MRMGPFGASAQAAVANSITAYGLFQPDTIMASQWADRNRPNLDSGEKRLWLAVLEAAVLEIRFGPHRLADAAMAWVNSEDRKYPGAFELVCDVVDCDASRIRSEMTQVYAARTWGQMLRRRTPGVPQQFSLVRRVKLAITRRPPYHGAFTAHDVAGMPSLRGITLKQAQRECSRLAEEGFLDRIGNGRYMRRVMPRAAKPKRRTVKMGSPRMLQVAG